MTTLPHPAAPDPVLPPLPRRTLLAALAGAALALPALLAGNMANPVVPGHRVGEPSAALAGVVVERESLVIDLRPLARPALPVVEATYRLRNDGPARELPLVFVADALADGGAVWLDGRPVPVTPAAADTTLPPSWRAPAHTPAIGGGTLSYQAGDDRYGRDGEPIPGTLLFRLPLDSGRHTVRVRYRADATEHSHRSPAINWQLGYVLSPARQWAGFGGLDARVLLPPGWDAAAEPRMERQGDTLSATWNRLPADHLGLTARAPVPSLAGRRMLLWLAAAAGLGVCIWAGLRTGAALRRRGRRFAWSVLPAAGLGLVWAVAVLAGQLAIPRMAYEMLGPQRARNYGYGEALGVVVTFPVLFLLCVSVMLIAAHRAHRRGG